MADTPEIKIIINKDWPKLTVYIKNSVRDDDVDGIVNAVQAYSENSSPSIMAFDDHNKMIQINDEPLYMHPTNE